MGPEYLRGRGKGQASIGVRTVLLTAAPSSICLCVSVAFRPPEIVLPPITPTSPTTAMSEQFGFVPDSWEPESEEMRTPIRERGSGYTTGTQMVFALFVCCVGTTTVVKGRVGMACRSEVLCFTHSLTALLLCVSICL